MIINSKIFIISFIFVLIVTGFSSLDFVSGQSSSLTPEHSQLKKEISEELLAHDKISGISTQTGLMIGFVALIISKSHDALEIYDILFFVPKIPV